MEYRSGSHTKYKIEYHFVWVTKYRYQILRGDLAERVRDIVRQTCEYFEIQILRGVVSKDHVHILVSAPPDISPSDKTGERSNVPKDIRGISSCAKTVSGPSFLGTRIFLRYSR
jgi:REP element-mobilizing transposase RayT